MKITQAVIIAGGFGTRLKPYTDTMPKPMIPIVGKPMLEWHIEQFKRHGVTEFFIMLHHLPGVVKEYFGDGSRNGVTIHYYTETIPLGNAGNLRTCAAMLHDRFYLVYGDVFSLMDYTAMSHAFESHPDAIGMQRVGRASAHIDADLAELNPDGSFAAIHPKPHDKSYPNAYRMRGTFVLTKEILSHIPAEGPYELGKELLPAVIHAGKKFYGYETTDYSKGIDTKEKWQEVETYCAAHDIVPWW